MLHPGRDCSGAVEQIAAWTTTHGVDLVAGVADVDRLRLVGARPVDVAELATGCDVDHRPRRRRHPAGRDAAPARRTGAGAVVSAPMGSTAYNYAAGGPVMSPGAAGVLVTPSAPMTGISRTLVIGPAEGLQLELTAGRPALELDGVAGGECSVGDELSVTVQPDAGLLVRIDDSLAAERSRVKLSLLDLPVLPEELVELVPEELRRHQPGGASQHR